jgi:hypothetical protein
MKENESNVIESHKMSKDLNNTMHETLRVKNNMIIQSYKLKEETENLTFEINELRNNLQKNEKREKDLTELVSKLRQRAKKFKPVKNSDFEEKT